MNKIKVIGISKSEFRSCYTFMKSESFFQFAKNFIYDLGFEGSDIPEYAIDKKVEAYCNRLDNFRNDEYSIDIIAFEKVMKVVINSRSDKQQEIVEILDKYID